MTGLFVAELGLSILLSLWFLFVLGPPWRSSAPESAWLLAAWSGVAVAFEALLLLALFKVPISLPLVALVLAAQDGVMVWRLVLLHRARQEDNRRESDDGT